MLRISLGSGACGRPSEYTWAAVPPVKREGGISIANAGG